MKKLIVLIALINSFVLAGVATTVFEASTDPSIFRTNTLSGTSGQGQYVNTIVPRTGYLTMVDEAKPTDSVMVTGNVVLYATLTDGGVKLSWIAKSAVTGNITSGNITGF